MEDEDVYCSICLTENKCMKLVKRASCYFCEDVKCVFVVDEDEYQQLIDKNVNNKRDCPNCSVLGLKKSLIYVNNACYCENLMCKYVKNKVNGLTEDIDLNKLTSNCSIEMNSKFIENNDSCFLDCSNDSNIFPQNEHTDCSNQIYSIEANDLYNNDPSVDFNEVSQNCFSEKDSMFGFEISKDSTIIVDKINSKLQNFKRKMLNWTRLPCCIPGHLRILCVIMVHLDIFNDFSEDIISAKKEYQICEAFSNNIKLDKVELLAYNFISKLFALHNKDINKGKTNMDMDERLYMVIQKYLLQSISPKKYFMNCSVSTSCPTCGSNNETAEMDDCFLSLERNKYCLHISENEVSYKLFCSKCKGRSNKLISLKSIPEFLMIRFPEGMKEDVGEFDGKFCSDSKQSLKLIAVIECSEEYPYDECQHVPITLKLYKEFLRKQNVKHNFVVHVRDVDSWYSLGPTQPIFAAPQPSPKISNPRHVRLLLLGTVPNSSRFREAISANDLEQRMARVSNGSAFLSASDLLESRRRKRKMAVRPDEDDYRDNDTVTSSGVSSASTSVLRKKTSLHSRSTASLCSGSTWSEAGRLATDRRGAVNDDALIDFYRRRAEHGARSEDIS